VGSASHRRPIQRGHSQTVEGQSPRWCQHPIGGPYNKITHELWKDKAQDGVSIPSEAHITRSRTSYGRTKPKVRSASHRMLIQRDHALAVEGRSPRWGQHPIGNSYNKITHVLWKDKARGGVSIPSEARTTRSRTNCRRTKPEVGSASHRRLIQRDHALAVEGQSPRWGQHPIRGSHNENTHSLWKDKVQDGVSIPSEAHTMRSRTRCGRTKPKMGSTSHRRLIQ